MSWLLALWLVVSTAYAQGYQMLPDGTWLCASYWNPGYYDRPIRSWVSLHGEAGLGIVSETGSEGGGAEKRKAQPWTFGGGGQIFRTIGHPAVKILAEGRYAWVRGTDADRPQFAVWGAHGALLFGRSSVWEGYYRVVLDERSVSWDTYDTTYTLTNTVYCDETSYKRSQQGYGVGAHYDSATETPAITLEFVQAFQVFRNGGHADIVNGYVMWGQKNERTGSSTKIGVGLSGRRVWGLGGSLGWNFEWWGTKHEGFTRAGTGFLLTFQAGFGVINGI